MTDTNQITDEILTAFLDGETDAETSRMIAAELKADPDLRARLELLSMPIEDVKQAFDMLLDASPKAPVFLPQSQNLQSVGRKTVLAAIAASLIMGVGLGIALTRSQEKLGTWQEYAAAYHALYVKGTLSTVEFSEADQIMQLATLSEVLGQDLDSARADRVLQFKRGQLLGYQGNPLVQIAYLAPSGDPVALCITRAEIEGDRAVSTAILEGMVAAEWNRGGFSYLLIGGTDYDLIDAAAKRLEQSI